MKRDVPRAAAARTDAISPCGAPGTPSAWSDDGPRGTRLVLCGSSSRQVAVVRPRSRRSASRRASRYAALVPGRVADSSASKVGCSSALSGTRPPRRPPGARVLAVDEPPSTSPRPHCKSDIRFTRAPDEIPREGPGRGRRRVPGSGQSSDSDSASLKAGGIGPQSRRRRVIRPADPQVEIRAAEDQSGRPRAPASVGDRTRHGRSTGSASKDTVEERILALQGGSARLRDVALGRNGCSGSHPA